MSVKILAMDGSGRSGSVNRKALKAIADIAKEYDAEVTVINLYEQNLPLYNGDIEEAGFPEEALKLKAMCDEYDAYLIATPEYNGSISPLLKNTIDWLSRPRPDEGPLQQFKGKVAGLISASPGRLGGMRALIQLNTILWGIGMWVVPTTASIPFYDKALNDHGFDDEGLKKAAASMIDTLVKTTNALKS